MKRKSSVALSLLLFFTSFAHAQGLRWDLGAPGGAGAATVAGSALYVLPNVQLNFCSHPANAVPCTNYATTYTSLGLSTPCGNTTQIVLQGSSTCVATSDNFGNLGVYAPAGTYDYTLTSNQTSYGPYVVTLTNVSLSSPGPIGNVTPSTGAFTSLLFSSVLQPIFPVNDGGGNVYRLGNDLVLRSMGSADSYQEHLVARTTTATTMSAGTPVTITVGAVTVGNLTRGNIITGDTSLFNQPNVAGIVIGRCPGNILINTGVPLACPTQEVIGVGSWSVVSATQLSFTPAKNHSGTTDVDQGGGDFILSVDALFCNSTVNRGSQITTFNPPMAIKDNAGNIIGYCPSNVGDPFPYGWIQWADNTLFGGTITQVGVAFASLGVPPAGVGTYQYCTDCQVTTAASCSTATPASCVCKGSGTGAFAKYENYQNAGVGWYCQ